MTGDDSKSGTLISVGSRVQEKLSTECFPQLYLSYGDAFEPSCGFRSLLGAMYLQMYWLMTAKGEGRRCKGPGCHKFITFEQPEQPKNL